MPRRRYWKKSVVKKDMQCIVMKEDLQMTMAEETDLIKNRTEDTGLLDKNSTKDLTFDVTEDTGLLDKNSTKDLNNSKELSNDLVNTMANSMANTMANIMANELNNDLANELANTMGNDLANIVSSDTTNKLADVIINRSTNEMTHQENFKRPSKHELIHKETYCSGNLAERNMHSIKSFKSNLNTSGHSEFLFGSFHQADERFSDVSRGRQCMCNSLFMLLRSIETEKFSSSDIDHVLMKGDHLYHCVIDDLVSRNRLHSYFLNFEELPTEVATDICTYFITKHNVIDGVIIPGSGLSSNYSLDYCIRNLFSKSRFGIILVKYIASAIFLNRHQQFCFFDSHSHGEDTMSFADVKAVLLYFSNIDSLITYLYSFYQSLMIDFNTEFNLLPLSITSGSQHFASYPAISSYFQNQAKLQREKRSQNKKIIAKQSKRRQYMKRYMKMKRQNQIFQKQDKLTHQKSMKRVRSDPEYQEKDKARTRESKKRARSDPEYQEKDKARTRESKKRARSDPEYQEKDKVRTRESKKRARSDPEYQEKDKVRTRESKKRARSDPEYQEKDRARTRETKKRARSDPEYQEKDKTRTRESMKKARSDPEYQEKDKARTRESMKKARSDPEYQEKDKARTRESMKKARSDPEYQEKDKARTRESMKKARSDPEYQEKGKARTRESKKKARECSEYRERKRVESLERIRKVRQNASVQNAERKKGQERMKNFRNKKVNRDMEKKRKLNVLKGYSVDDCILTFHESVKNGFSYVCTSCHQTWSINSVVKFQQCGLNFSSPVVESCRTNYISVFETEWICRTCLSALKQDKVPKISVANLFYFPQKPEELNLHQLEERLVSLRIPFMQIRELPRGRQLCIKGNVVNCPVDVQPTIHALPRQLDDNITIPVKLKRKQAFKTYVCSENVRPNVVIKALQWLMNNSSIYQKSGIKIHETWSENITTEENMTEFIDNCQEETELETKSKQSSDNMNFPGNCSIDISSSDEYQDQMSGEPNSTSTSIEDTLNVDNESDNFSEIDDSERITGNSDTLLDSIENGSNYVYTFAPGEGQTPLSLYTDPDAEYMSFPSIFCGQRRPSNEERSINVHYSDIAKWELRSVDRRVANNVPNIFYKTKKLQIKQVTDRANLAIRRFKTKGKKITVAQVLDQSAVQNLVNLDEGYFILRSLRNSPAYLSKRKKDIFSMIRQLGLPTWFVSLSAADTRWKDLLKILAKLNDNKTCTDKDIENMSWDEICSLIQKDPVTCSRHFHFRINQFITVVLKSAHNPIGEMSDYFYRTEFQHRGSPHIHMLIWIKNAPVYMEDPIEDVIAFIDRYVTCSTDVPEHLQPYVKLQTHKHSKTCRKKGKAVCRFGFPHPPMAETQILEPLQEETDEYKKKYEKIQTILNEMKDCETLSYQDFLSDVLNMSEDEYIKCIRSSLNSPKVFLRRSVSESRINPYMKIVLQAWNANHDIQFVLDPYACAMYIVSYISKSERGMSTLLNQACREARQGNLDIRKQVRYIGNKFLNAVETSAQEAVYLCLQLPLTYGSREIIFINTSTPDERTFLLKSKNSLEQLSEQSTDIEADNIIKRYAKRPKQLEKWCLADYASKLNIKYPKNISDEQTVNWDENEDTDKSDSDTDEADSEQTSGDKIHITLRNGVKITERKSQRIIRYVRFNLKTDSENYYREHLLLFFPWRNEENDLIKTFKTYEEHFRFVKNDIQAKIEQYEHFSNELDEAERRAQEGCDEFDCLAPQTQQAACEEMEEGTTQSEQYIAFNPDRPMEQRNYDIGSDIGLTAASAEELTNPSRLTNEEYYKIVRDLNTKQKEFFIHVLHWIKSKDEPLYAFLSGGAGVGKSVLICALYQALHRYLCAEEGENPEDIRILLCAPTGKAAFNIHGSTIHSSFKIPVSQGFRYKPLESETLNTLRVKYRNLSVVMIDEVSMVGSGMFNYVSERLKQIKGVSKPFGNVSVIVIGDLFQLKPVFDHWIFQNLVHGYGSLATNLWQDHFNMYELTEIMRQKDDLHFAGILNRLRENKHTTDDLCQLKQQLVEQDVTLPDSSVPRLYITRAGVQSWNSRVFDMTSSEKIILGSVDDVKSQDSMSVKQDILKKIPHEPSKTCGLLENLPVALTLKYDLTANIDTSDGLTNGASCTMKKIDYRMKNTSRPSILWVEFETDIIGLNYRHTYSHLYTKDIEKSWTPVFDCNRTFTFHGKSITRIQFPLSPSAAKTVHKAQGCTLNEVCIDMTMRSSIPHIHYVALSRSRSLSGLHIIELNESKISVDQNVLKEIKRLRLHPFSLCYMPIYSLECSFKIAFNNVRSLNLHYEDVRLDPNINALDFVAFAETRLKASDDTNKFVIDGFSMIRNDSNSSTAFRPAHGLAAYVRDKLYQNISFCHKISSTICECMKIDISKHNTYIQLIIMYSAPKCKLSEFKQFINEQVLPVSNIHKNLIIVGDFNFDVTNGANGQFTQFVQSTFNVQQIVRDFTTDYKSTLDLIFTNVDHKHTDVLECFWSDHKLVYATFDLHNLS